MTPLLDRGLDGAGQTIVLPEDLPAEGASQTSDIRADLAAFDARFRLPTPSLDSVGAGEEVQAWTAFPEEVIDVEMAHAIAPGARIRILRVIGAVAGQLPSVLERASRLGDVVSLSYGEGEQCIHAAALRTAIAATDVAIAHHITVVAASGDDGAGAQSCNGPATAMKGVQFPAADPGVLAVGGTRLFTRASGAWEREIAWNENVTGNDGSADKLGATGGGFSTRLARPSYQNGVAGIKSGRGVPDVSADADWLGGLEMVTIVRQRPVVGPMSGTSAATPLWAGIAALADQAAHHPLGFLNPAIYQIASDPHDRGAFHDVTTGTNTVMLPSEARISGYSAHRGWDPTTGWGSPDAAVLVPLLAARAR